MTAVPWHSTTAMLTKQSNKPTTVCLDEAKFTDIPLLLYTSGTSGEHVYMQVLHVYSYKERSD